MRTLKTPGASIYKDNNGSGVIWRVRLGKRFTGGVVAKKSFDTRGAAAKWLLEQAKSRAEHGRGAFLMSDAEVAEAQDANKRLAEASNRTGLKFSLTTAVTFFLRHGAPKGGRMSVREVIDGWLAAKAKTKSTLHGVRSILDRFAEAFGKRPINEIGVKDCQRFLDALAVSPNSKIHYTKDLSTVFEWAMKPGRQWLHENPWPNVAVPARKPVQIGILTPLQAGKLLAAAAAEEGAPLLASLVLGLFAGLRTEVDPERETAGTGWLVMDRTGKVNTWDGV